VMEEAALGDAGLMADVLDRSGRVAFGPDDVQGGVEKPGLGFVFWFHTA